MSDSKGQIRLIDLPGALNPGESSLMIQRRDIGWPDEERDDEGMLKEACQNRSLSESFISSRGLIGQWNLTELMLRAHVDPVRWKGSDQLRSHLGIPLLAENFYSILSVVQQTLFSGYRPFQIDPTADTELDVALAQEALINAELKTCGVKGVSAKQEIRAITYDGLLYGTGCGFLGWETKHYTLFKKRPKTLNVSIATGKMGAVNIEQGDPDDLEEYKDKDFEINRPVMEHVPLRRMRVAPDCRRGDIRTASWAGRLIYLSSYDLDQLRDVEGYNIPSREELEALTTPMKLDQTPINVFDTQGGGVANPISQSGTTPQKAYPESYSLTNVDPLAKKWEIFEYWTATRVVWVLEGEYALRNEVHDLNRIPFVSFPFREAPDSFFGYGLGYWLSDYQKIAQGIINAYFDDLNLKLMGTYIRPKGLNSSAQAEWIFPGKVFSSDTGADGIKPMERDSITNDPLSIVEQIKAWASSISGAGPGIMGANPGAPGNMRTGAGVNLMASGESLKMQDLIDQISELVFIPFLEFCVEMNRKLKPSQIQGMLSMEMGKAFTAQPLDLINGTYKVNISAGTKLAARNALNQSIGFLQTILTQPSLAEQLATQATKIDYKAMVTAFFESTGYPYREQIVKDMTAEDQQRSQANSQAAAQQGKLGQIQAQTQGKIAVNESQAENRALLEMQKKMLEHAEGPDFGSV